MLRIVPSVDAKQAQSYYTEALSREDYYSQGQEIVGKWGGKGAERLGLRGAVNKEAFTCLVHNLDPNTGLPLTPRTRAGRRVGYDFNFHAPKSVSLIHALTGDESILDAFRASVDSTMKAMECEMKTRVRARGQSLDRETGNMIWGEFVHLTARPVEGEPDPHLHSHLYVFNATYDREERRWKAGQFGDIKADAPYFEALFHATFAKKLREIGYPIERTAKGWEIVGFKPSTLKTFSRRTEEIEKLAIEKGITSAKTKDKLGAATRKGKKKDMSQGELLRLWRARLTPVEAQTLGAIGKERATSPIIAPDRTAEQSVNHALEHAFERASAVPRRKLLELGLRNGVGSLGLSDVERELTRRTEKREVISRLLDQKHLCTTADVLREERAMLAYAKAGRNTCRPLVAGPVPFENDKLTTEQRRAIQAVVASTDRVILFKGKAGVGKTTAMKEVVALAECAGAQVYAYAPSAEASRGVLQREGFANAETVARLLADEKMQRAMRGQVIWIDEAGLVGTKTLGRVFRIAQEQNARVILTGDSGQHASVERGDALRLLEELGGLKSPELKKVQRQRGTYREAVEAIGEGRIVAGFNKLDAMGAIREIEGVERHRKMADDYVDAIQRGKSVLAISPTHIEGERVTAILRDKLRDANLIAPLDQEQRVQSLRNLSWTDAQRADARHYEPGFVVQFHRPAKGYKIGDRATVIEREGDTVLVEKPDGTRTSLPIAQANRFAVYEPALLPLAPGDRVRVTQNGSSACGHRLHNGTIHELTGFDDAGNLVLANGWTVPRAFGHLTHGYVSTSHGAQGKTVDRVLIAESGESFGAANAQQLYVSVSRGRESVTIYTDNREDLLRAVSKSGLRMSASELVAKTPPSYEEQGTRVSRLVAQARAWASQQVERVASLVKQRPSIEPSSLDAHRDEILRKYGRGWANENHHQQDRGRYHERER